MRRNRFGFLLLAMLVLSAGAARAQTIHCGSDDGSKKSCGADTQQGVHLAKQTSDAPCNQGESWGYDEHGIWVDHGCAGDFALGAAAPPESAAKLLTCSSDGGKKYCDANTHHGVRLVKQHGDAPCKRDSTWGYDGLGIWVDQGCSADFALGGDTPPETSRSSGEEPGVKDKSCVRAVGKQRSDQLVKQCLQVSPASHPPCNAQNSCELITDEIRRSCGLLGRDAPAFCGGYK
jgi:hypothetical protein